MTSATGRSRANTERTVPGLRPAARARAQWLFRVLSRLSPALAARLAMRLFLTPLSRRVEPREAQFLATARALEFATPRGRLQAYEWPAPPGAGPTAPAVLVVHGWISHAARLEEVIRALSARGFRVVAFDGPAHGRSSGTQADLQAFRDAINTVIAACGPVQGVVAHSFGALTTAIWLAEDPVTTVRAAVLVGMMRDVGYMFESYTMTVGLNDEVLARLRALFRARYGGYPEDFATAAWASRLHLPVLLVHGALDELVPAAHATEIRGQLRDGELLIAPDLGHSEPLREPATVARIADFLAARLAPATTTVAAAESP